MERVLLSNLFSFFLLYFGLLISYRLLTTIEFGSSIMHGENQVVHVWVSTPIDFATNTECFPASTLAYS